MFEQLLDKIFSEYGLAMAMACLVAFYFYKRSGTLEDLNGKLQEDKLQLTKSNTEVLNIANRHIESSNEFMKSWPQVLATSITASQDKVISEVREMIRGLK